MKTRALSQVIFFAALALVITFTGACATAEPPRIAQDAQQQTGLPAARPTKTNPSDVDRISGTWQGEWTGSYSPYSEKYRSRIVLRLTVQDDGAVRGSYDWYSAVGNPPLLNRPLFGQLTGEKLVLTDPSGGRFDQIKAEVRDGTMTGWYYHHAHSIQWKEFYVTRGADTR